MQVSKINSSVSANSDPKNNNIPTFGTRFYVSSSVLSEEFNPIVSALEKSDLKKEAESFIDIAKKFYSDVIIHTENDSFHYDYNNGRSVIEGLDIFKTGSKTKITKENATEELKNNADKLRYELRISGNLFGLLPKKPLELKGNFLQRFLQRIMTNDYTGVINFNFEKSGSNIAVKNAKNEDVGTNFITYIQNNLVPQATVTTEKGQASLNMPLNYMSERAEYFYPER